MPKITFMGAGSTVFAKNVLGDSMMTPALARCCHRAVRYRRRTPGGFPSVCWTPSTATTVARRTIETYLGVENRKAALRGANYVVNAIQVGGYEPCTVTDFEIPKKYGLRQTIADTLGIGGIFRALRTIPVMFDFRARYGRSLPGCAGSSTTPTPWPCSPAPCSATPASRPSACATACRCAAEGPARRAWAWTMTTPVQWKIAGINHQAWLLEISRRTARISIRKSSVAPLAAHRKAQRHGAL